MHVIRGPILNFVILGIIKNVIAERGILASLGAQSGTEMTNMEVGAAGVSEKQETVDVEVAPEAATDDVVIALQSVHEWLHELSVERIKSGARRDVACEVNALVVPLSVGKLLAQPSELTSRILHGGADHVVPVIVDHSVEDNKTEIILDVNGVVATLLDRRASRFGEELLPQISSNIIHKIVGLRELVLRVSVMVSDDREHWNVTTKVLTELCKLSSNVVHFPCNNFLRECVKALCSSISGPQDEERGLIRAAVGPDSRNGLQGGVFNLERCAAPVVTKRTSLSLARIASIGDGRTLLVVTLHVII